MTEGNLDENQQIISLFKDAVTQEQTLCQSICQIGRNYTSTLAQLKNAQQSFGQAENEQNKLLRENHQLKAEYKAQKKKIAELEMTLKYLQGKRKDILKTKRSLKDDTETIILYNNIEAKNSHQLSEPDQDFLELDTMPKRSQWLTNTGPDVDPRSEIERARKKFKKVLPMSMSSFSNKSSLRKESSPVIDTFGDFAFDSVTDSTDRGNKRITKDEKGIRYSVMKGMTIKDLANKGKQLKNTEDNKKERKQALGISNLVNGLELLFQYDDNKNEQQEDYMSD